MSRRARRPGGSRQGVPPGGGHTWDVSVPDFAGLSRHMKVAGARPAEASHANHWIPGRILEWALDGSGWHAFFWPEQDYYSPQSPHGWLRLEQVRPADHEVRVVPSPVGYSSDSADADWWPHN